MSSRLDYPGPLHVATAPGGRKVCSFTFAANTSQNWIAWPADALVEAMSVVLINVSRGGREPKPERFIVHVEREGLELLVRCTVAELGARPWLESVGRPLRVAQNEKWKIAIEDPRDVEAWRERAEEADRVDAHVSFEYRELVEQVQ